MSIHDRQDLTQAARGDAVAKFILAEAANLGIGIATDGISKLLIMGPPSVPRETRAWFMRKLREFRAEVIEIILREAGGRS
jgi:hypothetical protein